MFFKFFQKQSKIIVKKNAFTKNLNSILDSIINEFIAIRQKISNLEKVNMDLALYHKSKGDLKETKIRFWILSKLWPKNNEAKYQLALCYFNENNYIKTHQILQNISNPDSKMAKKIAEIESNIK
ncbi:hypothetical protein N9R48_02160 [Rickettsiales bacterium]|jgi:thioredoxin-like negative regulator of GroEL|nr:hypothetical protein [Rickettsiales bacterium]